MPTETMAQPEIGRHYKVILGGILIAVIAGGYIAYTYMADTRQPVSSVARVNSKAAGLSAEESEAYNRILDRYNNTNATKAELSGGSYMSVMSTRDESAAGGEPEVAEAPKAQQPQPNTFPRAKPVPQAKAVDKKEAKRRSDDLKKQLQALVADWEATGHATARVSTGVEEYAASIRATKNGDRLPESGEGAAKTDTKIIQDFALVPALLKTDIDTDETSWVRAVVPAGTYAGAEVYAKGYNRLTNTVDMTFSYMKYKGRSYKITAKAVDQESMRTALSGEVNNRYIQRIILPAIAMGIGKAGQLYERANAQNIITPQGGIIQTNPSTPNGEAVAGTIIGGIGQQAGRVLASDAAKMPEKQVLIPKETTIGVQFIGPVLASDDIAGKADKDIGLDLADTPRPHVNEQIGSGYTPVAPVVAPPTFNPGYSTYPGQQIYGQPVYPQY